MKMLWPFLFLFLYAGTYSKGDVEDRNSSLRPTVVNVGAVLNFDSVIGRAAKLAIEAAIEDVNSNSKVLRGTKLSLTMQDNKYSGFLGIVEVLKFMVNETVAVIGPQSSVIAHIISHVANELQVPLLSFAATDPSLSSLQYPFFVTTTNNDLYQMAAVAEIVEFYGWKEVTVIFVDDDFGRNGVAVLGDKLAERRCKISYKAVMNFYANRDDITNTLHEVASVGSRVIILHTYSKSGLEVFDVAHHLGMMGSGYVWITTYWLSSVLDTISLSSASMNSIQGVITLRMHTPDSDEKQTFVSRWNNLTREQAGSSIGLNTFGLYAYDTVWLLAHAIDALFDQGGTISFSKDSRLREIRGGNLNLEAMNIFSEGNLLLKNILSSNLSGLTGNIRFTSDGSRVYPAYEVLNVIGSELKRIGYWSNYSGLSTVTPESLYMKPPNRSSSSQQLYNVVWPGRTTIRPRGWVFPNNGRPLRIGVPLRVSYHELISKERGSDLIKGYCIDVFTNALKLLPYGVPYKLIPYGDGRQNPDYDELVTLITSDVFDAVIGDIAIVTSRTRIVDFTQPYIESGLVVLAPVRKLNAWVFLQPFTPIMWSVICIFFLVVGAVVWILEHKINNDFRGPPKKQFGTVLWFSASTLFNQHRENTVSTLGRFVLLIWLFVVLIITSNYTARLSSILTVEHLSSPIKGIDSLIASREPIGFQKGSYTERYLKNVLNLPKSRLIPLGSPQAYVKALEDGPNKGGVAAVVDERAYVELFLSSRCNFTIVGPEFTKNGWGFAFPRDSPLAVDMTTAILTLAENGDLQRIRDKWLKKTVCISDSNKLDSNQLHLQSFMGLYILCGIVCFLALLIHFALMIRQYCRYYYHESNLSSQNTYFFARIKTFLTFFDKKEEVNNVSKRRRFKPSPSSKATEDRSVNEAHMELPY